MNILIIGGSRFTGPLLVNKLVKSKHNITVFNRGTHKMNFPTSVKRITGDRNKPFVFKNHFDVVVDMCAYNGRQTKVALDSLNFDLFVHFGSIASYKKSEMFPLNEESETGLWPYMGDYSKGKVECEQALARSGVKYATIRPTYILGPKNYIERESFIYAKLKHGQTIVLPGNGQAVTQFVFADDVVDILSLIIESKTEGAFNCVGDELITLKGLVEIMAEVAGSTAIIEYNPAADGANHIEEEFPFANENFICTNTKSKDIGHTYIKLRDGLTADHNNYYKSLV